MVLKINGGVQDALNITEGQAVNFSLCDATKGWRSVQDYTMFTGNPFYSATGGTD